MATIIAGHFVQQHQAQETISKLVQAGFASDLISSFYLNPPGQHDRYPIGGDRDNSPGAEHSSKGVATGGAVGAALGVAVAPIIGPAGPITGVLIGAHLGTLVGTLSQMDEAEETIPIRHSGMMVAVSVRNETEEMQATEILRLLGGTELEKAEGTIADGDWNDFNPLSTPRLIDQPLEHHA